jgi:hypothetical protein
VTVLVTVTVVSGSEPSSVDVAAVTRFKLPRKWALPGSSRSFMMRCYNKYTVTVKFTSSFLHMHGDIAAADAVTVTVTVTEYLF